MLSAPRLFKSFVTSTSRGFSSAVHTPFCVIGSGAAGVNVTAQLIGEGVLRDQIRVFDAQKYHHYQPGWTMVGGGICSPQKVVSTNEKMIPKNVPWTELNVAKIDADNNTLETEDGKKYTYEHLIICAGVQVNYDQIKGLKEALDDPEIPVGTIYNSKYAQKFSKLRESFNGKNAVFSQAPLPFKCPGAPQKIMHLCHDTWVQQKGMHPNIQFFTAAPFIFAQPDYAKTLKQIADDKQIPVNFQHNLIEVKGKERIAVFKDKDGKVTEVSFDILHATPPQGPVSFLKASTKIVDANGYVDVNPSTLRSNKYENIWAVGDCTNLPTPKTAAAIIDSTPVVVHNIMKVWKDKQSTGPWAQYGGYASCPLFVGNKKLLLAEFKYKFELDETFKPFNTKPNGIFYRFKTHLFPFAYFNLLPRGLWFGRHGIIKPSERSLTQQK